MERELLNRIDTEISSFESISLSNMDKVKLMSRKDTKFIFEVNDLPSLLSAVKPFYKVAEINDKRISEYKTDYYDTQQFDLYNAHHNGKLNRNKVRYREYVNSELSFFEIKFKDNKNKTVKFRIESWRKSNEMSKEDVEFLQRKTPYKKEDLKKVLVNKFRRITLVNVEIRERITIDVSLEFDNFNKKKSLNNLVVLEVKQEKVTYDSRVKKTINQE